MLFHNQQEKEINLYAENIRCFEIKKELVQKGGSKAVCDFGPVSDMKVCNETRKIQY